MTSPKDTRNPSQKLERCIYGYRWFMPQQHRPKELCTQRAVPDRYWCAEHLVQAMARVAMVTPAKYQVTYVKHDRVVVASV